MDSNSIYAVHAITIWMYNNLPSIKMAATAEALHSGHKETRFHLLTSLD